MFPRSHKDKFSGSNVGPLFLCLRELTPAPASRKRLPVGASVLQGGSHCGSFQPDPILSVQLFRVVLAGCPECLRQRSCCARATGSSSEPRVAPCDREQMGRGLVAVRDGVPRIVPRSVRDRSRRSEWIPGTRLAGSVRVGGHEGSRVVARGAGGEGSAGRHESRRAEVDGHGQWLSVSWFWSLSKSQDLDTLPTRVAYTFFTR